MGVLCEVAVGTGGRPFVATLGDRHASTASISFARQWLDGGEHGTILGLASFEAAADLVLQGKADYLLVPGAYEEGRRFFYTRGLGLYEVFRARLPAIVLVARSWPLPPRGAAVSVLYHHPALAALADEVAGRWRVRARHHVSSNPVACEAALADVNSSALALTTIDAARAYGSPRAALVFRGRMSCSIFNVNNDLTDWPVLLDLDALLGESLPPLDDARLQPA